MYNQDLDYKCKIQYKFGVQCFADDWISNFEAGFLSVVLDCCIISVVLNKIKMIDYWYNLRTERLLYDHSFFSLYSY